MSALHRKFSAITGPEDHAESTAHVESIEEIRSRIFGTHIGNGLRSGRKILRRKLVGEKIASYYPKDILKVDPFMPDLNAERYVTKSGFYALRTIGMLFGRVALRLSRNLCTASCISLNRL